MIQKTKSLWYALTRDHTIESARQDHRAAVRRLYRASAEMGYHQELIDYFNDKTYAMDPHIDWHYFASLKDAWVEHSQELAIEHKRYNEAQAIVKATEARLAKLQS